MTLISKVTGGLSLISCIYDMHKCGVIGARNQYAKNSANAFISNQINCSKMNEISYKNAQIKNWQAKNNYFQPIAEFFGKVSGYIGGFVSAGIKYIPNFIASAVAISVTKKPKIANAAAGLLAVLEGWNFIKNVTDINQRNDYLKL